MLVLPEPDKSATLERIRAYLAARPETARGEFTLPMLTGVLRTARREDFRSLHVFRSRGT
jgi:hypothetical protein